MYVWNPVIPSCFNSYSKIKTIQTREELLKGRGENGHKLSEPLCYAKFYLG